MNFPDFGNFPKYDEIWTNPGVKAAIDIGTNAVLLLIAEVSEGRVSPIKELQRLPRLGKGVDGTGSLSYDAMEAVIMVLHEYRGVIEQYGEIPVVVTATSAVRDASNKMEFLWLVEEATGYRVRVLSGEEEAQCSYVGALSQLPFRNAVCVDVGGGSTEIAHRGRNKIEGISINLGSVRLQERLNDKGGTDVAGIRSEIQHILSDHLNTFSLSETERLVAVAGTATTLSGLIMKVDDYDASLINGSRVTLTHLDGLISYLAACTKDEILALHPEMLTGREDLILAGACILSEIMRALKKSEFTTSSGGIRHGSLLTPLYN